MRKISRRVIGTGDVPIPNETAKQSIASPIEMMSVVIKSKKSPIQSDILCRSGELLCNIPAFYYRRIFYQMLMTFYLVFIPA